MIDYSRVSRGDILRIVGQGAPGFAELGDLVRVTSVFKNGVWVEDLDGESRRFVFNCGAARLEPTEWKKWKKNFPPEHQHSPLLDTLEEIFERFELPFLPEGFVKLTRQFHYELPALNIQIGDRDLTILADGEITGQGTLVEGKWHIEHRRQDQG